MKRNKLECLTGLMILYLTDSQEKEIQKTLFAHDPIPRVYSVSSVSRAYIHLMF